MISHQFYLTFLYDTDYAIGLINLIFSYLNYITFHYNDKIFYTKLN